jgi:hypothetical protein
MTCIYRRMDVCSVTGGATPGGQSTLISVQMCLGLAHHLPRPYRHLHSVIPRKVRAFLTTDRRLYC